MVTQEQSTITLDFEPTLKDFEALRDRFYPEATQQSTYEGLSSINATYMEPSSDRCVRFYFSGGEFHITTQGFGHLISAVETFLSSLQTTELYLTVDRTLDENDVLAIRDRFFPEFTHLLLNDRRGDTLIFEFKDKSRSIVRVTTETDCFGAIPLSITSNDARIEIDEQELNDLLYDLSTRPTTSGSRSVSAYKLAEPDPQVATKFSFAPSIERVIPVPKGLSDQELAYLRDVAHSISLSYDSSSKTLKVSGTSNTVDRFVARFSILVGRMNQRESHEVQFDNPILPVHVERLMEDCFPGLKVVSKSVNDSRKGQAQEVFILSHATTGSDVKIEVFEHLRVIRVDAKLPYLTNFKADIKSIKSRIQTETVGAQLQTGAAQSKTTKKDRFILEVNLGRPVDNIDLLAFRKAFLSNFDPTDKTSEYISITASAHTTDEGGHPTFNRAFQYERVATTLGKQLNVANPEKVTITYNSQNGSSVTVSALLVNQDDLTKVAERAIFDDCKRNAADLLSRSTTFTVEFDDSKSLERTRSKIPRFLETLPALREAISKNDRTREVELTRSFDQSSRSTQVQRPSIRVLR